MWFGLYKLKTTKLTEKPIDRTVMLYLTSNGNKGEIWDAESPSQSWALKNYLHQLQNVVPDNKTEDMN